jgi:hypothetical protein
MIVTKVAAVSCSESGSLKLRLCGWQWLAVTMLELGSLELSIDSFQVASSLST